jgi:sRNA-binding carbon storage regulator CsrA
MLELSRKIGELTYIGSDGLRLDIRLCDANDDFICIMGYYNASKEMTDEIKIPYRESLDILYITDSIKICYLNRPDSKGRIGIGFEAPDHVEIARKEVYIQSPS